MNNRQKYYEKDAEEKYVDFYRVNKKNNNAYDGVGTHSYIFKRNNLETVIRNVYGSKPELCEKFIKYIDYLEKKYLFLHNTQRTLKEEVREILKSGADLNNSFFEVAANICHMDDIVYYRKVSIAFLKRHWNKIDHNIICMTQDLPEDFMDEKQDELNWYSISEWQKNVSKEFFIKHLDRLHIKRFINAHPNLFSNKELEQIKEILNDQLTDIEKKYKIKLMYQV